MAATLHLRQLALPLAIIGTVFGVAAALLLSPATIHHPALAKAALADLLVTGPVLFLVFAYLRKLPLIIIVPVANIGLELALLTAPADLHPIIRNAMWITYPLLAAVVLRLAYLTYRQLRLAYPLIAGIPDARDRLHALLDKATGTAQSAAIMTSDLAFLRYAIWAPKPRYHGPGIFSSHRQSGLIPLLWAIVAVVVLETVVLHILVHLVSPVLAWVLSALSLYGLLSLVGHIRALPRRYSTLGNDGVTLRTGLFGQCNILYRQIAEITPMAAGRDVPPNSWQLGILGGMEPRNLLLVLHHPATIEISHGMTRRTRYIAIHMDDPQGFANAVLQMRDQHAE